MANTYQLIASNTLTSSAASVTFSSIPATYTDLILRCSIRTSATGVDEALDIIFNSSSATNYSRTMLQGNGTNASSARTSNATQIRFNQGVNGNTSTSNTFTNLEYYIPNYLSSTNKPLSYLSALENNASEAYIDAGAGLWRDTSAITSMTLDPAGINFLTDSSFYLYGIKNS